MNRKPMIVIAAIFIVILGAICVLSYELYETHRWNDIYFRHMMQAQDELEKCRTQQKMKVNSGITIPNPLFPSNQSIGKE